jgi:dihydropteroate synthase
MERIGVDPVGVALMTPKQFHFNLLVKDLAPAEANILKQDALSVSAEAAISRGAAGCEINSTDALLSGTLKQLSFLAEKLRRQPYGLRALAEEISRTLENLTNDKRLIRARTRQWDSAQRTLVMGILNVTPDSFSDAGRYFTKDAAVKRALEMADEGADIIDVGGESTRPGAENVAEDEELGRVAPVVEELACRGIAVSVDTTKSRVAEEALLAGAEIINDISAMTKDPSMAGVVAKYGAAVVLMHMRGTPQTMQTLTHYEDLMGEVMEYLSCRMDFAGRAGIETEKIVVDPGIGFAKNAGDNIELIRRLGELTALGRPILIGASRKSFIGNTAGAAVWERLGGSLSAASLAVLNGAGIVRTHDVKETKQAITLADSIKRAG